MPEDSAREPRLPRLTPDRLAPDQLALYERMTAGLAAPGEAVSVRDAHGALDGPFGVLLHAPAVGGGLYDLGEAVLRRSRMSPRLREIAILCVAAAVDSGFTAYAHERIGRLAGLTDEEVAALRAGAFTSVDPAESAAYELCGRLLAEHHPLDDAAYEETVAALGHETVLELVVLVGCYRTVAQVMDVFGVHSPRG